PSFKSSPWIRDAPHSEFSVLMRINSRSSQSISLGGERRGVVGYSGYVAARSREAISACVCEYQIDQMVEYLKSIELRRSLKLPSMCWRMPRCFQHPPDA